MLRFDFMAGFFLLSMFIAVSTHSSPVDCQLMMYLDPADPNTPIDPQCSSETCDQWGGVQCYLELGGPAANQVFCLCDTGMPQRRVARSAYFDLDSTLYLCDRYDCANPCPLPGAEWVWLDVDGDGEPELVWYYMGCRCP